jgi:hypothetical protein
MVSRHRQELNGFKIGCQPGATLTRSFKTKLQNTQMGQVREG